MKTVIRNPLFIASFALYLLFVFTAPGMAAMVGSRFSGASETASTERIDPDAVRTALENKIVIEKLKAYGLTEQQALEKIRGLSDEQCRLLAQASDRTMKGGSVIFIGGGLLLLALVIIVIILAFK